MSAFAGVVVVNLTPGAWDSGFAWNGEGFVLLCAVAYGASTVTTKLISKREKPETITAYQLMMGGAILILMGYLAGGTMGEFTPKSACLFFYLAFLSTISFYHLGDSTEAQPSRQGGALWFYHSGIRNGIIGTAAP